MRSLLSLSLLSALLAPVFAQTTTSCNPLNVTCPADDALGMSFTWNMTNTTLDTSQNVWNQTNGALAYGNNEAQFTISQTKEAPTIITNFKIFWGSVSIVMKAATGQGIVSSVTMLSDDRDEIDWEFIGGNNTHVQTNYFGKGMNYTYDRAIWVPVSDPQNTWHNYTINWSSAELQWLIDGAVVRSLPYAEADDKGYQFPQTPLDVQLGNWPGCESPSNYTIEWAGGACDYSKGPFTMSVASVTVNDGSTNASTYSYGDHTGSFQSIKVAKGISTHAAILLAPPPESLSQKINNLPVGAKIGIAAGIGSAVILLAALCTCCCVRQRRAGRRERALADAEWDKSNAELLAYRRNMANGGFANAPGYGHGEGGYGKGGFGGYGKGQGAPLSPLSPDPQYAALKF